MESHLSLVSLALSKSRGPVLFCVDPRSEIRALFGFHAVGWLFVKKEPVTTTHVGVAPPASLCLYMRDFSPLCCVIEYAIHLS